jgi:PAS domain S-box-containing protein
MSQADDMSNVHGQPPLHGSRTGKVADSLPLSDLQLSEQALWEILDTQPDGILLCGSDGRMLYVNGNLELLTGYDRADLLGHPVETLVPQRPARPRDRQPDHRHRARLHHHRGRPGQRDQASRAADRRERTG